MSMFCLSGDIGHVDDDGHVFIVDRLKELIKYKGFQVSFHTIPKIYQFVDIIAQNNYPMLHPDILNTT